MGDSLKKENRSDSDEWVTDRTLKKAELLIASEIQVPEDFELPFKPSRSTAGPDAGRSAIVFEFDGTRVRMSIVEKKSKFSLKCMGKRTGNRENWDYTILKNGKRFVDSVRIIPTLLHAPSQVFINMDAGCRLNCLFCPSPRLPAESAASLDEKLSRIDSLPKGSFDAIAITSGIPSSPGETVSQIIDLVRRLKVKYGSFPIGVEAYTVSIGDLKRLRNSGVEEMKLNLQSTDRKIFRKVCPQMNYEGLLRALEQAPRIFGKGKVCSNILIGLGESDDSVLDGVQLLAGWGVVPNLRLLRVNEMNRRLIESSLGGRIPKTSLKRLLCLAKRQKDILREYCLGTQTFKTMCHRCGCCDIVPFVDV